MAKIKRKETNTGSLIKKARSKKAYSMVMVSEKMGTMSRHYLYNVEYGACVFPRDRIKDLARALGIKKSKIIDAMTKDFKAALIRDA